MEARQNLDSEAVNRPQKKVIKILVLGSSYVGKSSIIRRYCLNKYSDSRRVTVGADYMTKKLLVREEEIILQIWDTAGQERFHQGAIGSSFYRGADGALLVYEVTNERPLEQICHWRDEAVNRLDPDVFFPIVVVGNKIDLHRNRSGCPDHSDLRSWCVDNGYGHINASAKDGDGVQVAVEAIVAIALDTRRQSVDRTANKGPNIRIDDLYSPHVSSACMRLNC